MSILRSVHYCGLALLFLGCPVLAQEGPGQKPVTLSLQNATLADAADALSQAGGIEITIERALRDARVSLQVTDVPAEIALKLLAEVAGLVVVDLNRPGAYLLQRTEQGTKPQPVGGSETITLPLRRGEVKKVRIRCANVPASSIAGYFGRPGITQAGEAVHLVASASTTPEMFHAWLPAEPGVEAETWQATRDSLGEAVRSSFYRRWAGGGPADQANSTCSPFLRLPDGIAAVIGYDPASSLIAVGDPAATEAFKAMVAKFDVPDAGIDLGVSFIATTVMGAQTLGLKWQELPSMSGRGTLEAALVDHGALKDAVTGPFIRTTNAAPVVVGLTRLVVPTDRSGQCEGFSEAVARNVAALAATTDLKLRAWLTGKGGQRSTTLFVDPGYGHVDVELNQRGNAELTLDSAIPCVASPVEVPAGKTLVLRQVNPVDDYRAPDACPFLAKLPLVSLIYRPNNVAKDKTQVLVAITPVAR